MAHELIHADRYFRGTNFEWDDLGTYRYQTKRKKHTFGPFSWYTYTYQTQTERKEELATAGLKYYTKTDITENMIREEHGLNLRGAY